MEEKKRNSLPGKYEGFAEPKYAGFTIESRYAEGFDGTKLGLDLVVPTTPAGKQIYCFNHLCSPNYLNVCLYMRTQFYPRTILHLFLSRNPKIEGQANPVLSNLA